MPSDAGQVDPRDLVVRHLPGQEDQAVRVAGEGLDNVAYDVGGRLILRVSKQAATAERAATLQREADLLVALRRISSLPTPELVHVDPGAGALAYTKVPGQPLLGLAPRDISRLGAQLGEFLSRLHAAPTTPLRRLAPPDAEPPSAWLDEARGNVGAVGAHLPASKLAAMQDFLHQAPPAPVKQQVFCHNDLGAEHIMVAPRTGHVTGIIDWGDAALTDPAHDLAKLYRDLGPKAYDEVLTHYAPPVDETVTERVRFFARCGLLEDLRFGVETGRAAYVDAALRSLSWTF